MKEQDTDQDTIVVKPTEKYALYQIVIQLMLGLTIILTGLYTGYRLICLVAIPFLFVAGYRYLYLLHTIYYITPQQIIFEKGLFSKDKKYLEMYRVRDFDYHQDLAMRMLNVQKITLLTFDQGEPILNIRGIPNSDLIQKIRDRVQECRKRNKILTMDN